MCNHFILDFHNISDLDFKDPDYRHSKRTNSARANRNNRQFINATLV